MDKSRNNISTLTHPLCLQAGDVEQWISSFGCHGNSYGQVQQVHREIIGWDLCAHVTVLECVCVKPV